MFDIGWGELVVIGVVALIAIGPKELPAVLRTTGQWMGKIRRMASEFQDQFREAMREAEMEDLKKKVDDVTSGASSFTNFDPLGTVRKEFENLTADDPTKSTTAPASETATPETSAPAAQLAAPEPSEPAPSAEASHSAGSPATAPADTRKAGEGA
jgi:sec-independent protein translocase protein TatB